MRGSAPPPAWSARGRADPRWWRRPDPDWRARGPAKARPAGGGWVRPPAPWPSPRICCSPPLRLPASTASLGASSGTAPALDRATRRAADPGRASPQLEVLAHGHEGEVAASLRHEPDAELEPRARRQPLDGLAVEPHAAAEVAIHAVDGAQERGLAGAVGPDQRGDGAGRDGGGEVHHHGLVGIARRHPIELEDDIGGARRIRDGGGGAGQVSHGRRPARSRAFSQIGRQHARVAADHRGRPVGDPGARLQHDHPAAQRHRRSRHCAR